METKLAAAACAATFLFAVQASADPDVRDPPRKRPLERRIILPDLLGVQIGSPVMNGFGAYTSVSGLISYSTQDSSTAIGPHHAESLGIRPSLDVRAGRFTIGGTLDFTYSYARTTFGEAEAQTRSTVLELVPRVGVLFPITRHVTLWPRVSAGFLVGTTETTAMGAFVSYPSTPYSGFIAGADLLVVFDLGSHFFLAGGPNVRFSRTTSPLQSDADLRAGATAALGVAF